jgi:hypothetical protein
VGGCSFSLPFPLAEESSCSIEVEDCSMELIGLVHTGEKRDEKDGNAWLEDASLISKISCGSCMEAAFPFQLEAGTNPGDSSSGLAHVMDDEGEKAA